MKLNKLLKDIPILESNISLDLEITGVSSSNREPET